MERAVGWAPKKHPLAAQAVPATQLELVEKRMPGWQGVLWLV
jgi:hypothetical protein